MIDGLIIEPDDTTDWNYWSDRLKAGSHMIIIDNKDKYYRTMVDVEDVGFEIRDTIMYMKGEKLIPLIMTRLPIEENTIAENCLEHGTGGINIDDCRIGTDGGTERSGQSNNVTELGSITNSSPNGTLYRTGHDVVELNKGRWPANVILDEEAGKQLDEQSGELKFSYAINSTRKKEYNNTSYGISGPTADSSKADYGKKGGASRFFFNANSKEELIDYLTKMIKPPKGKVLVV